MKLSEVKAVVTGGASGLGLATVRRIIAAGGRAAILDRPQSEGERIAGELGESAIFTPADVTSEEAVTAALDRCVEAFGGINVCVNCAGVGSAMKITGKAGPMPLDVFRMTIEVNLIGTFNVSRLAATRMLGNEPNEEGERGVIVNTASIAAFDGQIGQVAYSASKAGVVGMTLVIARDLAREGIRCCTIAPGTFDTPMLALLGAEQRQALAANIPFPNRLGRPDEFAALACHVVENPYLNGETIRLDGALRMPPR
ncbi:MAG: 3-hydroxyacyl-CoA dehydrogenase [Candidatus Dadabacteria bacterium]|nr:MAG: 3-hydroxyacyl-CoA dehydrogenase [Candidatus Dadabacteria bacterium]